MYSLLLFLVIVWLTEMVISINQGIFFSKKEGWGEGIGGENFEWWKAKRRSLCAQGITAGRVSRST